MQRRPSRLAATYSIVARDPVSGDLGVAVQSNYFSVGTDISWAEPGVGAIATQAVVEVSYGPKGLELLSRGMAAEEVLAFLLERDPGRALRQVAVLDAAGRAAAHTGEACVHARGQVLGEGYSVQGNMLASDEVWRVMGPTFEKAGGALEERLLLALEAAEAEGGDVRGRQSAAVYVVAGEKPAHPWEGRRIDLHVEDDPDPLKELRRLLTIRQAHDLFDEARDAIARGDLDSALVRVERARALLPANVEFAFWMGVALANAGRNGEARRYLDEAFRASPAWRELARRIRQVGFYHGDPSLIEP